MEPHVSPEQLELYSMGRLEAAQAAALEEHLLVCEECCERLAQTEDFIAILRAALRRLAETRSQNG